MIGHSPSRRLLGGLAASLVLAGILASCGESRLVTSTGAVVIAPGPVAQITMPPDRDADGGGGVANAARGRSDRGCHARYRRANRRGGS